MTAFVFRVQPTVILGADTGIGSAGCTGISACIVAAISIYAEVALALAGIAARSPKTLFRLTFSTVTVMHGSTIGLVKTEGLTVRPCIIAGVGQTGDSAAIYTGAGPITKVQKVSHATGAA